jgi:hypothetical protein
MMSVAFGQKGRCEMKLFEIRTVVAALFGFGLLAGLDSPSAHAGLTFGELVNLRTVAPATDAAHESVNCFSSDGLEMYIGSDRSGGTGDWDLWVLRRLSTEAIWGPPENLGLVVNSSKHDGTPSMSADDLTLYFCSDRPGGYGRHDIYMTTRATKNDPWGKAVNLGPAINTSAAEVAPWISPNGLELYLNSWRPTGYGSSDIYVTRRATTNEPWGELRNLGAAVNSAYEESAFSLSPDGLLLLFADNFEWNTPPRPGGHGGSDIWMTWRASLSDPWQASVNLGLRINSSMHEVAPRLSPDGSTLYFTTNSDGTWENWQVPILPVVDFTGDGHVDGKDLRTMVVQLGGTDSLCDIGPYAWGDGVVDTKDLTVLAEYIGKEVVDGSLIAHWKLDETEGITAADSAGDYNGSVTVGATWQPQDGMVGGALKCDGVTGCVLTDTIPNLGTGPFSVIAWIKGGAPGQIILSHGGTTDWLMANPIDGSLMTKLTSNGQPLAQGFSEVVITDGKWHRIALVWDGTDRILYVDGKEVARDPQPDLSVSDGKFIIGAGSKAGTGWSGLIDDVRIYSRVVRP